MFLENLILHARHEPREKPGPSRERMLVEVRVQDAVQTLERGPGGKGQYLDGTRT